MHVELAHDRGERTNRKELLAPLILAASETETRISRLGRRYSRATVEDAFGPGEAPAAFSSPLGCGSTTVSAVQNRR
jgi:hypothetical protein